MGVQTDNEHGYLRCCCPDGLNGARITLAFPSVGATENIMLAGAAADGTTIITNAAREPEIEDLQEFLNTMGAKINGAGSSQIQIEGVKKLYGAEHTIIPDRIVAATYLIAGAITGGDITVTNTNVEHIRSILSVMESAGCKIHEYEDAVGIEECRKLKAVKSVRTMPYPGFPTDAQAPMMALMCAADGDSMFIENIFEKRYGHAGELMRMGAGVRVEGRTAIVEGGKKLTGAHVEATDLRGGAALVLAGLAAEGITEVSRAELIDRGYEQIEKSLQNVGAIIKRG
jgi:UDP-N-acetylglucosamine 1-carboxyvinyltransferase